MGRLLFSDIYAEKSFDNAVILVTTSNLGATTTRNLTATARPEPSRLEVVQNPRPTMQAGEQMDVAIEVFDLYGNMVSNQVPLVATLGIAVDGVRFDPAALQGDRTTTASNGRAIFKSLEVRQAADRYHLIITSPIMPVYRALSAEFNIIAAQADSTSFVTQPPAEGQAGVSFNPAVVVQVIDKFGNRQTAYMQKVTLILYVPPDTDAFLPEHANGGSARARTDPSG